MEKSRFDLLSVILRSHERIQTGSGGPFVSDGAVWRTARIEVKPYTLATLAADDGDDQRAKECLGRRSGLVRFEFPFRLEPVLFGRPIPLPSTLPSFISAGGNQSTT